MIDSVELNFIPFAFLCSDRGYTKELIGRKKCKLLRTAPLPLILRGIELGEPNNRKHTLILQSILSSTKYAPVEHTRKVL